jgi:hypothetical protein
MQRPSDKASIKEYRLDPVAMDEVSQLLGNAPQEKRPSNLNALAGSTF